MKFTAKYAAQNLCGWAGGALAAEQVKALGLITPKFQIVGAGADDWKGKRRMLYEVNRKVLGKDTPNYPQEIGDCFPAGTMVRMADGSEKTIESVEIGEYVLTPYGHACRVISRIVKDYEGELVTIKAKGQAREVTATPDHRFKTINPLGEEVWTAIGDIQFNDRVLIPYYTGTNEDRGFDLACGLQNTFEINDAYIVARNARNHNPCKRFIKIDKDFAWIIGLYLAEGGVTKDKYGRATRVDFNLGTHETDIISTLQSKIKDVFGLESKIINVPSKSSVTYVRVDNSVMARFIKNLIPGNTYSKRVPTQFACHVDPVIKMSLLRGWIEGDGHERVEGNAARVCGVSVSAGLIQDLYHMCLSMRIKASVTTRKASSKRLAARVLNLYGKSAMQVVPSLMKDIDREGRLPWLNRSDMVENGFSSMVKQIERHYVESVKVFCLEVEDEHAFIANGYAVHNCVSFGGKNALEHLQCAQILLEGADQKFRPVFPPYFYGTSRVQVGGGQLGNGDGSLGAWLQEAAKRYGVLPSDEQGVPQYAGSVAKQWGYSGPPNNFLQIGQKQLVKTTAKVTEVEDAANALFHGYPIPICSNQGFNMTASSDGFHAPRGTWGHCVLPDEIIGAHETLRAKDVRIGDYVIGHDGKEHEVTEIFERHFKGDMAVISAAGITPLKVTHDHPVLVYRRMPNKVHIVPGKDLTAYGNGTYSYLQGQVIEWETSQPTWVRAADVQVGDYLMTPIEKDVWQDEPTVPEWKGITARCKNVPLPLKATEGLAWLFGLYIADGTSEPGRRSVITLNKHETDVLEKARKIIEEDLGLQVRIIEKPTYYRLVIQSSVVADNFCNWFGVISHEKKIPSFLFEGWNRRALVEGLLAGDGSRKNGRCSILSTSDHLIQQLRLFLISIGENPKVNVQKRGLGCYANARKAWTLNWNENSTRSRFARWGGYYLMPVTSNLLLPYEGTVYNYEIDKVHSYLANGVIVHNCMCLIGYEDHPQYGLYFIILNSWGDQHGHLKDFTTGEDLPVGVLRVRAQVVDRMLKADGGDSYAFSQFDGFPGNGEKIDKAMFDIVGD